MALKKSPRTPRNTGKAVKTRDVKVGTPTPTRSGRPSRQSARKSLAERSDSEEEESEPEPKMKGQTSPYFSKTKGKGKGPAKRTGKAQLNGSAPTKGKGRVEKDPQDVTGLTETETESDSPADDSEDDFAESDEDSVAEDDEEDEDEDDSGDSDDFDDTPKAKKRKVASKSNGKRKANVSAKKGKHAPVDGYEDEENEDEVELEEDQELAGRIYPAPKTGQVPPGRISQNTLNFLKNLQIPERNDREWFRCHEPAFRQAENEWKAFVGTVQLKMQEADDELPLLPPKDVIHRIYRDVRFSSDKTPYKRSFSLSTSRSGRKGLWAGYHLSLCPNDKSILACGVWCPEKNELATIRHHILTEPERLRDVIGDKDFVKMFGPAKPHKEGKRQNVFGHDDALKIAPKIAGVDKDHKDIDLLKLRTVAVVHHWTDEEVIDPNFQDEVRRVMEVMRPFVHLINDFISLPP